MEIANFVIGLVALVVGIMAIPTICQMFFGRPRLTFEAVEFTGDSGRCLLIEIKNQPTKNKLLRWMRVERDTGQVHAWFSIREQGTGKVIADVVPARLVCVDTQEQGLLVRALPDGLVGVQIVHTRRGDAHIIDGRSDDRLQPISEGNYVMDVSIVCGEQDHRISHAFRIRKVDHETIWWSRNVVSIRA
jgi:hypothetical protein